METALSYLICSVANMAVPSLGIPVRAGANDPRIYFKATSYNVALKERMLSCSMQWEKD